jgi:hypothetical protein
MVEDQWTEVTVPKKRGRTDPSSIPERRPATPQHAMDDSEEEKGIWQLAAEFNYSDGATSSCDSLRSSSASSRTNSRGAAWSSPPATARPQGPQQQDFEPPQQEPRRVIGTQLQHQPQPKGPQQHNFKSGQQFQNSSSHSQYIRSKQLH